MRRLAEQAYLRTRLAIMGTHLLGRERLASLAKLPLDELVKATGLDAVSIYRRHLEATSLAALRADIEAFVHLVSLPSHVQTADVDLIVTTPEELGALVRDYVTRLAAQGVIEEREVCREAAFVPGMTDMVAGVHETTWVFADGRPPHVFLNRSLLIQCGSDWRLMWLQSELECAEIPVVNPAFAAAQRAALDKMGVARR